MFSKHNYIYYQFLSEKDSYTLEFETTVISISDIKRKIIARRIPKLEKTLENKDKQEKIDFDLWIYDEKMVQLNKDNDNEKVEPHRKIYIRRVPILMTKPGFIEIIGDNKDYEFEESKENNDNFNQKDKIQYDSLIKYISSDYKNAGSFFNQEVINYIFSCNFCFNRNKRYGISVAKWITTCCGESLCERCIEPLKLKEVIKTQFENMITQCKVCSTKFPGILLNVNLLKFKEKLSYISNNLSTLCDFNIKNLIIGNKEPKLELNPESNLSYLLKNSRYFTIKSNNLENILTSKQHNVWATTKSNHKNIVEAFNSKEYTILIYSANRSRFYQGFALMTSLTNEKNANFWNLESVSLLGNNFSVIWLASCEVPMSKFANVNNDLTKELVGKNRDTHELPKDVGIDICKSCIEKEKEDSTTTGKPPLHLAFENEIPKLLDSIRKEKEKNGVKFDTIKKPVTIINNKISRPNLHIIDKVHNRPHFKNGFYPSARVNLNRIHQVKFSGQNIRERSRDYN